MTRDAEKIGISVRSVAIVDADGTSRYHLRVFCPVESRSIDPRICGRCDLCVTMPAELVPGKTALVCNVPRRADPPSSATWFVGHDPIATWTPAGAVAGPFLVCAREGAPMSAVSDALAEHQLAASLVVDEHAHVLGSVSRLQLSPTRHTPVLSCIDAHVAVVAEGAPLAEVIARMAYRRAHQVALVSAEGRATGLVSETALLHWIALGGSSW